MIIIGIVGGILLLLIVFFISVFNELTKERVLVQEAWSGIGAFLQQRLDAIPNLVEIVKGYTGHENKTPTDVNREARKYGVGFLLASQTPRDFDSVVFDNMGTKISLQLEGDDSKIFTENFGITDSNEKTYLKKLLMGQKPLRGLIQNNHYEPFKQVDIIPFFSKE